MGASFRGNSLFLKFMRPVAILTLVVFCGFSVSPFEVQAQVQCVNPSIPFFPTHSVYQPVVIQGMTIHPDNPLKFDFIIDAGDFNVGNGRDRSLRKEYEKLIKYFIASLATPEKDMWVNLSPYEPDRIVPQAFGQTEMGRDLLAQDYLLKQLTASLMNPEGEAGKKFWEKVYSQAYEKYGATDIPIDTFNKVWIVPQTTSVYESPETNTVFVAESQLDVMLEGDYLAQQKSELAVETGLKPVSTETFENENIKQIIREIILPEIKREVNEGEMFAPLRQIMNSLILARWYKDSLKESILNQVFANQEKTAGTRVSDPNAKQKIYEQYVQTFQKGAYDVLREEYDPFQSTVITKRYFSGGIVPVGQISRKTLVPQRILAAGQRNDLAMMTTDLVVFHAEEIEDVLSDRDIGGDNAMMISRKSPIKLAPQKDASQNPKNSRLYRFLSRHREAVFMLFLSAVIFPVMGSLVSSFNPYLSLVLWYASFFLPIILTFKSALSADKWSLSVWVPWGIVWATFAPNLHAQLTGMDHFWISWALKTLTMFIGLGAFIYKYELEANGEAGSSGVFNLRRFWKEQRTIILMMLGTGIALPVLGVIFQNLVLSNLFLLSGFLLPILLPFKRAARADKWALYAWLSWGVFWAEASVSAYAEMVGISHMGLGGVLQALVILIGLGSFIDEFETKSNLVKIKRRFIRFIQKHRGETLILLGSAVVLPAVSAMSCLYQQPFAPVLWAMSFVLPVIVTFKSAFKADRWSLSAWMLWGIVWSMLSTGMHTHVTGADNFWNAWMLKAVTMFVGLVAFIYKFETKKYESGGSVKRIAPIPFLLRQKWNILVMASAALALPGVGLIFNEYAISKIFWMAGALLPVFLPYQMAARADKWALYAWLSWGVFWTEALLGAHSKIIGINYFQFGGMLQAWIVLMSFWTFIDEHEASQKLHKPAAARFDADSVSSDEHADDAALDYGGIDLEKMNVGRVNGSGSLIKIHFTDDPAMLEELQGAAGLRAVIRDMRPVTMPMLNGLLGLNADGSENKSADSVESFEQLVML